MSAVVSRSRRSLSSASKAGRTKGSTRRSSRSSATAVSATTSSQATPVSARGCGWLALELVVGALTALSVAGGEDGERRVGRRDEHGGDRGLAVAGPPGCRTRAADTVSDAWMRMARRVSLRREASSAASSSTPSRIVRMPNMRNGYFPARAACSSVVSRRRSTWGASRPSVPLTMRTTARI